LVWVGDRSDQTVGERG